jgi:hypothetical protein
MLGIMVRRQSLRIARMSIADFRAAFRNERDCNKYLVRHRWPNGVRCPRCGSAKVYPLANLKFKWECPDRRRGGAYRFSHLVGTIFENTNVGLLDWFRVIHAMTAMTAGNKKISMRRIQRDMGFGSYKTAWSMCHRIRAELGCASPALCRTSIKLSQPLPSSTHALMSASFSLTLALSKQRAHSSVGVL